MRLNPCWTATSTLSVIYVLYISPTLGAKLFVGTNAGVISTINFDGYNTRQISVDTNAAPLPSWQTIVNSTFLISTNEGPKNGDGSIVSYKIESDGRLSKISKQTGLTGLIHAAVSPNHDFIVAAAYYGHGVAVYPLSSTGGLSPASQTFKYTLYRHPAGAFRMRQEDTHPHQIAFDPSGKFMLVNDLGADVIRIYAVRAGKVTEFAQAPVPTGFGPRHGVFITTSHGRYYYVVGELANHIAVYQVTYTAGGAEMNLMMVQRVSSCGDRPAPLKIPEVTASGIEISPDKHFLYVSNRGDASLPGTPPSDSISAWKINQNGTLKFLKLLHAGGSTPRHFSIDPSGKYVAVALQGSNLVSFYRRDTYTGLWPDRPVASWHSPPGPTCVQWLYDDRDNLRRQRIRT
ncbi:hypothetical protein TWF696_000857 [Orbilia brochopaga]|uniref:6-phosphogluconolactonase n=1 Tax=Orbilia brochopaga TaxID=3140254 RepID=A0AAV9VCL2_9PEZI